MPHSRKMRWEKTMRARIVLTTAAILVASVSGAEAKRFRFGFGSSKPPAPAVKAPAPSPVMPTSAARTPAPPPAAAPVAAASKPPVAQAAPAAAAAPQAPARSSNSFVFVSTGGRSAAAGEKPEDAQAREARLRAAKARGETLPTGEMTTASVDDAPRLRSQMPVTVHPCSAAIL